MSEIEKLQQNLPSLEVNNTKLPMVISEIYEALHSPTATISLPGDIYNVVKNATHKSFQDTGFRIDGTTEQAREKLIYLITEVSRYIKEKHPALRLNEIPIAFARGIRKQYGDYMGLSVISFCNFIDAYVKDEDQSRKKALAEKNKPVKEEKKEPSLMEYLQMGLDNAIKAFNDVKSGNDISLYGHIVFRFLEGLGLIDITEEEIKEYRRQAKEMLIAEYTNKAVDCLDRFQKIDYKKSLDSLTAESIPDDMRAIRNNRAKSLAVKAFMESIIFDDGDLEALIVSHVKQMLDNREKFNQGAQNPLI